MFTEIQELAQLLGESPIIKKLNSGQRQVSLVEQYVISWNFKGATLMEDIVQRKNRLLETLRSIPNKDERLRYIVEQGKAMPAMPEGLKIDPFIVKGCISRAWLVPQIQDERLSFAADSEALIVKGIIALLLRVYNGSTGAEILALSPEFLSEAGVSEHLSMNRRNGLANVVGMIRFYAERLQKTAT